VNRSTFLDPVPVRFPRETKRRLKLAQRRFNLNASEIIRRAVEQKLPEWESSGMIVLEGRVPEEDRNTARGQGRTRGRT
jgi:hypothetical protein